VAEPAIAVNKAAQWDALRAVYPFFVAAARQFRYGQPPLDELPAAPVERRERLALTSWLEGVDKKFAVHELRKLLDNSALGKSETTQALVARYLSKDEKTGSDRDKLDYLLAHYLRINADDAMLDGHLSFEETAKLLESMWGESPADPSPCLEALEPLIDELCQCSSLGDLDVSEIIQRGRTLKVEARETYFRRSNLIAFARFNFLLGCTFRRLLLADLNVIGRALDELEARGVATVNCAQISLDTSEPIAALRDMCRNWQQPSHQDYTDLSFQRIVKLRHALETALNATPSTQESRLRYLELRLEAVTVELEALRRRVGEGS
jgi:hypothetical protein